jgi:cytochrome c biogenesis protein CcmG, thiol:disulfide interchange protein DsbE
MRRLIYLLPVILFMTLVGYFAVALRPNHDPLELPSALIDKEAPDFSLAQLNAAGLTGPDQNGATPNSANLSRDALKGGPVLINFFASWCVPCRIEHPLLMRLAERDHVPLYGIDYKDKPEDATKLLADYGDPYRGIGMDLDGRVGLDFGVYGVPETYVLDSAGHIRKRFVGPLTAQQVDQELLPLLKQLGRP